MYDYVRVILILYKPPGEEDEFLTLCFRPIKTKVPPKSLLLTSPLLACHSTLTSILTFRHTTIPQWGFVSPVVT
jgi:hypothetical protein